MRYLEAFFARENERERERERETDFLLFLFQRDSMFVAPCVAKSTS
jgi:hypothetical protein